VYEYFDEMLMTLLAHYALLADLDHLGSLMLDDARGTEEAHASAH
jgi:hypothetical protein